MFSWLRRDAENEGTAADDTADAALRAIDAETLRRALAAPERHRDLVVRVAGFTAYFVTLKPELQAEIVARAEAAL